MPLSSCWFRLTATALSIILTYGTAESVILEHHGLKVEADASYTYCLSCHEGVLGKEPQCVSPSVHPVMNVYPPRGKEQHYASVAALRELGVKFELNKISCVTCHNLGNDNLHHLVIDNKGSRLCLACHIRK